MRTIELTFLGRIPSKKNSRNIFVSKTGKRMNIPSTAYKDWHKSTIADILNQLPEPLVCVIEVVLDFYMPDNRKCDLTNKAESIMDLLVDAKIIEDDCWQYVPMITLRACGVDKEKPRVNVTIKYGG